MANPIRFRKGLEANRTSTTFAVGEPVWTTDTKEFFVGDGSTPGGIKISNSSNGSFLIGEFEISSPVTSVTFSNLDGNLHGGYRLDIELVNNYTGDIFVGCFANDDHVNTNYYSQTISGVGSLVSTSGENSSNKFLVVNDSKTTFAEADIMAPNGYFHANSRYTTGNGSPQQGMHLVNICKSSQLSGNLTKIDLISSQSNSIGIGSKFRIYRRK